MTAKEVKARAAQLRERRAALEERLAAAPGDRGLQLELAGVREDLIACARQLRELVPRHKISYRTTSWDAMEGHKWVSFEDQTWEEVERRLEPDEARGPTRADLMRQAAAAARQGLTDKQGSYMDAVGPGIRQKDVARARGVDKSTVSRTLKRGRTRLERDANALYTLMERRTSTGALVIDLADPEILRAVLDLLTDKQQMYIYLYYGEWLSLREIGQLCGAHHTVVLRSIRAALERLDQVLTGQTVKVRGLDALEERLIELLNAEELAVEREVERPRRPRPAVFPLPRRAAPAPEEPPKPLTWTLALVRRGELRSTSLERAMRPAVTRRWGSGRLLHLLTHRLAPAVLDGTEDYNTLKRRLRRAMSRCLQRLFRLLRRDAYVDNH